MTEFAVEAALALRKLRIAVVHEWLVDYSGSERVVEQVLKLFPWADLFAVVEFLPESLRSFIQNKPVTTTFIQRLPRASKRYRSYLPLMPLAVEQLDLSAYDLVLSSSHAVAKGVLTGPDQLHVSYVHSPMRYAWDLQHTYLKQTGLDHGLKGWLAKWFLHKMRIWDARTANGVDSFVANSCFIARRIEKIYRREAKVIYPPVDIESFSPGDGREDFYLTASRMVPYKNVGLIVEAFSQTPKRRLVVIGDGPELARFRDRAGANVEFLGYQDSPTLRQYMQRAQAFVFAAEEDFGITPVEAQACGTPVIALGRGGALETIVGLSGPLATGVFFPEQTVESLLTALREFEAAKERITVDACRRNAERFSQERFRMDFLSHVTKEWDRFRSSEIRKFSALKTEDVQ